MAAPRKRRVVLVVEDDADARQIHTTTLRRAGFQVITATTGPAAIALAKRWKPILVVLDIALPGIDGLTAIERMRSDGSLDGARVMVVTAMSRFSYEERARTVGSDRFLVKPVLPEQLVEHAFRLVGVPDVAITTELVPVAGVRGEDAAKKGGG